MYVSKPIKVHDSVYSEAERLVEEKGVTKKEAIRQMCRDGGYDV